MSQKTTQFRETFSILGMSFDVDLGNQLAENLPLGNLPVDAWKSWLSAKTSTGFKPGIYTNEDHLDNVDLEKPLLLALVKFPSGTTSPMIIDGWHRLARALRDDVDSLPARMLSPEDSRRVRI